MSSAMHRGEGSGFGVQGSECGQETPQSAASLVPMVNCDASPARLVALCFVAVIPAARSGTTDASTFADRLTSLAAKCDELALNEQAEITRGWIIKRHPRRQYLFLPATTIRRRRRPVLPGDAKQWHKRFLELRRQQATELFTEAKAANDRQPDRATRSV